MRLYRVCVWDKYTQWPLEDYYDVKAWTKRGAKRKVFKHIYKGDTSYLLEASRIK